MSFLGDLKIAKEVLLGEDIEYPIEVLGYRNCEWIEINDRLHLSIQASSMHYCLPRVSNNLSLEEYTHFELALIVDREISGKTKIFENFSRYDELMECFDGGVFAYVEKDLIEDLYKYCKENLQDNVKL